MSNYKLLKEEDNAFHIQHPDGSNFKVAKKVLSPQAISKIRSMGSVRGYAEGTDGDGVKPLDVEKVDDSVTTSSAAPLQVDKVEDQPQMKANPELANQTPAPDSYGPQPVQQGPQMPPPGPIEQLPGNYGAALKTGEKAAQQQYEADVQRNRDVANTIQQNMNDQKASQLAFAKRLQDNEMDRKIFQKKIINGQINPDRVFQNKDTSQRISDGIMVLLGGIGAGLAGGPNQGVEYLKRQQDLDIAAQKADLGKNENLLAQNLRQYGDINQAEAATRLQQNDMMLHGIQLAGANAGSPAANAARLSAQSALENQAVQLQTQLTGMQVQNQAYQQGFPAGQVPPMVQNNKELSGKMVNIDGQERVARSEKDAEELKKMEGLYVPIQKDVALLKSFGPSAITDPGKRDQVKAALGRIAMSVNEFNGYNRFTDTDKHTIESQFNNPSAISQIFSGKGATNDTLRALDEKLQSERKARIYNYGGSSQSVAPSFKPIKRNI